jgi:GDPmannose 4,6-dehydratase
MMLQQDKPDDYVIGTGESHSVREFLERAFSYAGMDCNEHVRIDQRYMRPNEVSVLKANCTKARTKLAWSPKVSFVDLIKIMVDSDMESIGLKPIGEGKRILESKGMFSSDRALFNPTGGIG